jgi:16S rRNA (guanine527-N7)-methyltransferase
MNNGLTSWNDYCALENVSRETIAALRTYERLLREWSRVINLVSEATLPNLWLRHFADSLQLRKFTRGMEHFLDLGSGAGFPGLVLALDAIGTKANFHLIEVDQRKCAFLRAVVLETGASATVHCSRIEQVMEKLPAVDVVMARALKPLPQLVSMASFKLEQGAIGLFPKGREFATELTLAEAQGNYVFECFKSLTNADARIITVKSHARA